MYLQALFSDDIQQILHYETVAAQRGYGPLSPCTVTAAIREQKQFCRAY